MTAAIVAAIRKAQSDHVDFSSTSEASEPSLDDPTIGSPISHGQIIVLSKLLRHADRDLPNDDSDSSQVPPSYHLDDLIRGAKIYKEPPKPKAEPVSIGDLSDIRSMINSLRLQNTKL